MFKIARELKSKNIAEYLIYMWQVEDLIRANQLDIDKVKQHLISPMKLTESEQDSEIQWFKELIDMMFAEGVNQKGHLQINQNVILSLTDLHHQIISGTRYPFYNTAYYKVLPFIVELRSKNGEEHLSEIEICFNAMYGVMLLRLQGKEVSQDTAKAIEAIASFLSTLANYYAKDKGGELKFED